MSLIVVPGRQLLGRRLGLEGIVREHVDVAVQSGIEAKFQPFVLDSAHVQVRELGREQNRRIQRREHPQRLRRHLWGPRRRRGGGCVERRRREVDAVLGRVPVDGGAHRRAVPNDARVPDLVGGQRFLLQVGIAHRMDREDEACEQRRERTEIGLIEDRRVDVAVDERRRTKRTAERDPKRLSRIGLHHESRPRREDRILDRRELVHSPTDDPSEMVAEKYLVLGEHTAPHCDCHRRARSKYRTYCAGSSRRMSGRVACRSSGHPTPRCRRSWC